MFALIVANSLSGSFGEGNSPDEERDPILTKSEVADFLVAMGISRETISKMNISDVYPNDISDDSLERVNMSREEGARFLKDLVHQVIASGPQAIEKCLSKVLESSIPPKPKYDFGPKTLETEREKTDTITIYGRIPKFETQEERQKWMDKLGEVVDKINEADQAAIIPDEVVMYGIGDGYLVVGINKEVKVEESLIKEVYAIFDEVAKNEGIMDIPVVFTKMKSEWIKNCGGRDEKYRPIWGGIQVVNPDRYGKWFMSTIGYPAIKTNGDITGYVVSGHLSTHNQPTPLGYPMFQPDYPDQAGYVLDVGGTYSDSAFVKYSNVYWIIYITGEHGPLNNGLIVGHRDPAKSDTVHMSGITSGLVDGVVKYTGVRVINDPVYGTLYDQMLATYPSAGGDSGAPVFYLWDFWLKFVWINGINKGVATSGPCPGCSCFSPQSGIVKDLGLQS